MADAVLRTGATWDKMKTTVILCTYNRCESLAKALASAACLELPESVDWELLVVDNNSNDRTREVVENFCGRYTMNCRYLFEPHQGKSHALNTGIREARGDVLAFMDDDVIVDRSWLRNLTGALRDAEWAGAGGRILPQTTFTAPPWLPLDERYGLAPLAMFDLGPDAGPLAEAPFGTNMAFRKEIFEKYGEFRSDLGPRPGSELRGEDSEFGHRLIAAGERLRYEPLAVVYHDIPQNRLRKGYFLDWWFDKGRSGIREFGIPTDTRWLVAGMPLYTFRRLAVWTLRWIVAVEPRQRFGAKLKVWATVGEIEECFHLWRDARRQQNRRHSST